MAAAYGWLDSVTFVSAREHAVRAHVAGRWRALVGMLDDRGGMSANRVRPARQLSTLGADASGPAHTGAGPVR